MHSVSYARSHKLWGGRFKSSTDHQLEQLNASIHVDRRMYAEDIVASQAYAKTLNSIQLLTNDETSKICTGLDQVKQEWDEGSFNIVNDEDIHSANERRLKEIIGEPATKLHMGRSRNDQVATDMKLWLRGALKKLDEKLRNLIEVMVNRARDEIDYLMPGYTHLQRAQPVRWSHWLLSHAWNFKSDCEKIKDLLKRVNVMPLGSGALAGNPFDIDRNLLAHNLGFSDLTQNSMQAVGDRDYIAEFLFWASLTGIHLTRLSEDLIIYSSKEFNFVEIHDSFSTGSSLMPQKRNPDSLELIRGVGGGLFGQCCSFMMVLKSLPSTYNKDLQGDKEAMFSSFDKMISILDVASGTLESLKVNASNCHEALSFDMLATDLAYYLVRKSVPFREAHHIAGKVVSAAEARGVEMYDLTLEELKTISKHFDADVAKVWNYVNSVEQYEAIGGTAKNSVLQQIQTLDYWLEAGSADL
ncbi:PREDICTED: argininosuccinate lyase [Nicrophorus vespilloides]|uniref:Argininosuccinate lyase n=1 Tax=Nicrophorus vespilloides TaxID=110193 RepID=A0ABM1MIB2_NICVS|nr:PREDICTED: argininosuccinate lyase [Nicrophorus vespilloides]